MNPNNFNRRMEKNIDTLHDWAGVAVLIILMFLIIRLAI